MTSIRKRLLFNLLGVFVASWLTFTAIAYNETFHEIEELFDAQLAQAAGTIAELTLANMPREGLPREMHLAQAVYGHKYERKISFQVWEASQLLFRSQNAPTVPLTNQIGFSDQRVDGANWRIFSMRILDDRYMVYAAESYEIRQELIYDITESALLPLILALPTVTILIWLGIGRGVEPLQRVAREVHQRNPNQLTPLKEDNIPREIRPLTSALNGLLKRLQRAFEMERHFTSNASHELRTPLAAIKTQAQVALRAENELERRQALQKILEGVDRSTHLVEQMLTLARLEPEGQVSDFKKVDLARLIEKVIADMIPLADEHHIELSLSASCPTQAACMLNGLEPALTTLARNLIDNAIRYTPAGGQVELTVAEQGDGCELTVTDTGPGIPESERERVFDRFYRPSGQATPGCGLGLSIVQHIADLHGAELSLSTPPSGKGLQVTVHFAPPAAIPTI